MNLIRNIVDSVYSQIEKLARHDCMTGLLNHQHVRKRLTQAIQTAMRHHGSVYVILIDIDRFKILNDRYGHPIGDKVIRSCAGIINGSRRTGEYAGRLGGEEFLVILRNADREDACTAAERIMEDVRNSKVPLGTDTVVRFRVSMGIAGYPLDGFTTDELIDKADKALYTAKFRGRDRYVVWSPRIDSELSRYRADVYAN